MSDYIDIRSELCKSCIHTKICRKDKNLVGDIFVMGHPAFFDNDELFRKYKEREAAGFPCEDYMQERKRGEWIRVTEELGESWMCSECMEEFIPHDGMEEFASYAHFCPNCGAQMESEARE